MIKLQDIHIPSIILKIRLESHRPVTVGILKTVLHQKPYHLSSTKIDDKLKEYKDQLRIRGESDDAEIEYVSPGGMEKLVVNGGEDVYHILPEMIRDLLNELSREGFAIVLVGLFDFLEIRLRQLNVYSALLETKKARDKGHAQAIVNGTKAKHFLKAEGTGDYAILTMGEKRYKNIKKKDVLEEMIAILEKIASFKKEIETESELTQEKKETITIEDIYKEIGYATYLLDKYHRAIEKNKDIHESLAGIVKKRS